VCGGGLLLGVGPSSATTNTIAEQPSNPGRNEWRVASVHEATTVDAQRKQHPSGTLHSHPVPAAAAEPRRTLPHPSSRAGCGRVGGGGVRRRLRHVAGEPVWPPRVQLSASQTCHVAAHLNAGGSSATRLAGGRDRKATSPLSSAGCEHALTAPCPLPNSQQLPLGTGFGARRRLRPDLRCRSCPSLATRSPGGRRASILGVGLRMGRQTRCEG
jgi:hypothetical protein